MQVIFKQVLPLQVSNENEGVLNIKAHVMQSRHQMPFSVIPKTSGLGVFSFAEMQSV